MKLRHLASFTMFALVTACGGGSDDTVDSAPGPSPAAADISLLFMGNSHTSVNELDDMVTEMVRAGMQNQTVAGVEAPGWMFLDERSVHQPSLNLLRSQDWSFVILQAQKYSTTGQFTYSTEEAKELVRAARLQHATPVMFPEWPRRDVDETERIYDLHVSIAQETPACVAPIGQAWDLALARHPALVLHDADGNHSAPAGAFLAALVLYATITGRSPGDLPHLPQIALSTDTQANLRAIAAETVQLVPPRQWCPADPLP